MQVPSKETDEMNLHSAVEMLWDDLHSKVEMQVPSKETDEMTFTAR